MGKEVYKAKSVKKLDHKMRHVDPERREYRRRAAENKKGYSKYVKKASNRKYSVAKDGSVPNDKVRLISFQRRRNLFEGKLKIYHTGRSRLMKVVTDLSYRGRYLI